MTKQPDLNDDVLTPNRGELVPRNSDLQVVLDRACPTPCPGIGIHDWEDRRMLDELLDPFACRKCRAVLSEAQIEKIRASADPADSAVIKEAKAGARGALKAAHYQADGAVVYSGGEGDED